MTTDMQESESRTTGEVPTDREFVSIVIPIDSAVADLRDMIADLRELLFANGWKHEFVLVDDGTAESEDLETIKQSFDNVQWIRFHQGFGEAVALTAGMLLALTRRRPESRASRIRFRAASRFQPAA